MLTGTYIHYLKGFDDLHAIEDVSRVLDGYHRHDLAFAPWHNGGKRPAAAFSIAYSDKAIYLKYYVIEATVKAEYSKFNDPVFEDSCVEFFIAFGTDANYYNLEFNCMGTSRVQFGSGKHNRTFVPASLLKTIQHQTVMKNGGDGSIQWELTLCIPKNVFMFHPQLSFEQSSAKANFYKCGDKLPQPHFLCWNNIIAAEPEFHMKDFFKEVTFSPQVF